MEGNNYLSVKSDAETRIFFIRGVQVILDKDLAEFYQVKPIRLREQIKRNINRFPGDFMFQLTEEEVEMLVSQNAIPSRRSLGGYMPYVFTEQGVTASSAILKSERAVLVSIQIVRAFVAMRRFLVNNARIFERLESVELKQLDTDKKINQILNSLQDKNLQPEKGIFFDGQVFDAWKFVSDLIRSAQNSLILLDNYVDDSVLQLFSKRRSGVAVTIYTKSIPPQLALDLRKFNQQYDPVLIKEFHAAHDRFLIIDRCRVFHIGASLKDLGKKLFAFSQMDEGVIALLKLLPE